MTVDHIRYDILTQDALRGVVRTVLIDASKNGLPGEHHFFITFDSRADGVHLSKRMREQYPEEMTVVLQHQFWDLTVTDERFEVGLSFGGVAERLVVPFASIKSFVDPSVQFGVQFEVLGTDEAEATDEAAGRPPAEHKTPAAVPASTDKTAALQPASANDKHGDGEPPDEKPDGGGAEVVRLDRFRKK